MLRSLIILATALVAFATPALAQNTGGVFPPGFGPDHKSLQYRGTIDVDNGATAQRLHYQQSLDDRKLWRIVGQVRGLNGVGDDLEFDFVQAELFWQLSPRGEKYETGLRFDGRLRGSGRPEQIGINWMNQWTLDDGWRVRAVGLSALQLGKASGDDISLQARGQIARKLDNRAIIGLEAYVPLGTSGDVKLLKGTTISAGPFVSLPIHEDFAVLFQPLIGLTDVANDLEARVWLTRNF